MSLGSRIRELRIKRGYTQAQIALRLGMTEANFSSYERDKSTPPSAKLSLIADTFDVPVDYLLGRSAYAIIEDRLVEPKPPKEVMQMGYRRRRGHKNGSRGNESLGTSNLTNSVPVAATPAPVVHEIWDGVTREDLRDLVTRYGHLDVRIPAQVVTRLLDEIDRLESGQACSEDANRQSRCL